MTPDGIDCSDFVSYCCYNVILQLRLQLFHAGNDQVNMLLDTAKAEGFSGGLFVDFPHKGLAKKYFLCLSKGPMSKGSSRQSEGQMLRPSCPLALPLHCKLLSRPCINSRALLSVKGIFCNSTAS